MISSRTPSASRAILATVAAVLAAVGAGYVMARLIGTLPRFALFETSDRRHLDEIPIDRADACAKVETIHAALGALNTSYTAATFGFDPKTAQALMTSVDSGTAPTTWVAQPPWPTVAAGVDASAAQLDLVLADGIPHFPPRIQRELSAIRTNIAKGRAQLEKVDGFDTLNLTRVAFDRGQLHAGYAGDLVGNQCSVPLGA